MRSGAPVRIFHNQLDLEIEELGRDAPVRWVRFYPGTDAASLRLLKQISTFAESTDRLVTVYDRLLDSNAVTYVFRDDAAAYVMALVAIAQTRGSLVWRIEQGETAR